MILDATVFTNKPVPVLPGPNPWDESAAWWQVTKKFMGLT
jgi:hypothetical protein